MKRQEEAASVGVGFTVLQFWAPVVQFWREGGDVPRLYSALGRVPKGPPRPGAGSPHRAQHRSFPSVGSFSLRPGVPHSSSPRAGRQITSSRPEQRGQFLHFKPLLS